jgi:predicted RecA/RadA family phage recombinase
MKNFVQPGGTLTFAAPYDVIAGAGFKVGSIVAIATAAALNTVTVEGVVAGVFDVAKVSAQAWAVGERVYWDDTARLFTTTASANTLVGAAVAVAANPSATGRVRLNGAF